MIIDDHILIREFLSLSIGHYENFEVIAESGDGQQAIELARDKRPDLIMLDINMSPMNGFEVLKMIRKMSPTTKIIGLSMHSQPAYAKKMLRLGAKGYMTKNSHWDEIELGIKEVIKGNTYICREVRDIISEQILNDGHDSPDINLLSERETQIVKLLREGFSSKEIGTTLKISNNTVEAHRYNILKKLKLKNTVSLINYINSIVFE